MLFIFLFFFVYELKEFEDFRLLSNYTEIRTKFQSFCKVYSGSLVEMDDIQEYNAVKMIAKAHSEFSQFLFFIVWHM